MTKKTVSATGTRTPRLPGRRSLLPEDKMERDKIAKAFGQNLLRYRKQAGLSQAALAARSFLRDRDISALECQRVPTFLFDLLILADALGVLPEDLLAGLPVPRREASSNALIAAVGKQQGVTGDELASALNVHWSYIARLAGRLLAEGRLEQRGRSYWSGDTDSGPRCGPGPRP